MHVCSLIQPLLYCIQLHFLSRLFYFYQAREGTSDGRVKIKWVKEIGYDFKISKLNCNFLTYKVTIYILGGEPKNCIAIVLGF